MEIYDKMSIGYPKGRVKEIKNWERVREEKKITSSRHVACQ